MKLAVAFIVLALATTTLARPEGAPAAACVSMMPSHGVASQAGSGPFSIYSNVGMRIDPSTNYRVSVTSNDGTTFRGLFCQVREDQFEAVGPAYGYFISQPRLQTRDCSASFPGQGVHPAAAITHSERLNVDNATFYWRSPENVSAIPFRIRFVCTVVVDFSTFYTRIAGEVFYSRSPPGGVTTSPPETSATPASTPVTTDGGSCPAADMATNDADRYRAYLNCWSTRFEEWNRAYQAWLASGGRGCA